MKLGVITVPLYDKSLDEALGYLKNLGVETVVIGDVPETYMELQMTKNSQTFLKKSKVF